MGSVFVEEDTSPAQINSVGVKHFKTLDFQASGEQCLASFLRDGILLASWLVTLVRSREDRCASFEWAYKSVEGQRVEGNLSTDDIPAVVQLETRIGLIAQAAGEQFPTFPHSCSQARCPDSLVFSTGLLSQNPDEIVGEDLIHLEVSLDDGGRLTIRSAWHSERVLPYTIDRHIETLVDIMRICIKRPDTSIQDFMRPTRFDLDSIWRWCHELPPTYEFCIQDLVTERAQQHPDKTAVDSWDGILTYSQVEQHSTLLANSLRHSGVQVHEFVPLCFEKSRWTIVAVLAVMKAGATIAMMDPSLPLARLQNMREQIGASTIICSRLQTGLAQEILPEGRHFVLEADTFTSGAEAIIDLPPVPPTALMYIIFTSGSTGTPKGVKISHQTYTSSAIPRARAVGYNEDSRVLDFASYAFDVSIDSMLLTLSNGGCLCIPSDEDRLNDINSVMRKMRINYAGITPSVARILDQDVIASLSALGLGGEASAPRDVNLWGQDTRIVIGYGPCECTIGCTVNSSAATGRDYISIGPGNGAAIWIVDPNDHNVLMPVGAVGELLVEGPIVGQGYLNDPDKTAAAFIHDPPWLLAGHGRHDGRHGRLYKTGDLGMYDPSGSGDIVFAGRKDTQVKLRGQRVELGEIESQLKARLPSGSNVIVEVITPQASGGQPTLVAFVSTSAKVNGVEDITSAEIPTELDSALANINTHISTVLPRYMIPNAYIPTNYIPTLISGKIDRKRLRLFGATVDLQKLDETSTSKAARAFRELNDLEQRLRHAWGLVLKVDEDSIHPDDNFFALGGESLAAMRLVSVCREKGLDLSVTSTFGHPTLASMAETVRVCDIDIHRETSPFSLISQSVKEACMEAAHACGKDTAAIEDIYPCTPTQESLVTFALKSTEPYVAQRIACVPPQMSLDVLKRAWETVVAANPIMRTRVAQLQDPGLQQVVLREEIDWRYATDLGRYLEEDRNQRMDLGHSLARYAIVDDEKDGKRYMVWTVHHVQYDGWSEPLILSMVVRALQNEVLDSQAGRAQMKNFAQWIHDSDEAVAQSYWRDELAGAIGPQFPKTPSRDFLPNPDGHAERHIDLPSTDGLPFTIATLIRGAWALVSAQYSGSDDVVFGETLTGRDVSLRGVEDVLGPLNATVPIRVRIDRQATVASFLRSVQQGMTARTPHQHMGMQYIRRVSVDAQHACEAPTGIVVQPEPELVGGELGFELGDPVLEALHFNPYPLMLAFGLRKGGFRVCANFDSSLVSIAQMDHVLAQLETTCAKMLGDLDRKVAEISCVPDTELDQIWRWNKTPPLSLDEATGRLRADASTKYGAEYPRVAIPWVVDSRNVSFLAPIGCPGELWLEGYGFSSAAADQTPAWLAAGSSQCVGRAGTVHPTGDMVQLQPDGSLFFVGRKDDVVPVSGHAVNIAELEVHCARLLPPSACAAATVFETSSEQGTKKLVIFVEQQQDDEGESVEIMFMQHDVSCNAEDPNSFKTTIRAEITTALAVASKKLDKFIHEDFPSTLTPVVYVFVQSFPMNNGQIDRVTLKQLASNIPEHVLHQVREGLKKAWETALVPASLSVAENTLRSAWAVLLHMAPERISVDDNFFRLGGDSVLAMKLVSGLRGQGHGLTVADIFNNMRLSDAARVMKMNITPTAKTSTVYKPFSVLNLPKGVGRFLAEIVRPQLAGGESWSIKDAAPVTDSQALDIVGTIETPRTSVQYTMLYLDCCVEQGRLFQACKELVRTHEILRTVFVKHDATFFQVVLQELDVPLERHEVDDEDLARCVNDICLEDARTEFVLGTPFLKFIHIVGRDNSQHCLVIRLSHAQYDGMSLPRLLEDFEVLYAGNKPGPSKPFLAYMASISDKALQSRALNYWRNLLQDSSLSVLPGQSTQPNVDRGVFKEAVAVDHFVPLPDNITIASVVAASWALVLTRRLQQADVTFGGVTAGRSLDMPGVEDVVGPCYQLTPIRVPFASRGVWTAADLLSFVQNQSAESAAYDFIGLDKIAAQCTGWTPSRSNGVWVDSLVHHQDWDDSDSMPFAGGEAKLDVLNPHGDAPSPLKVVSFARDGGLRVGLVGCERDSDFVESVLAELVNTVKELTGGIGSDEGLILFS